IRAAQFEAEVTGSSRTVLVEFFMPLCSPCREMMSILGEIAEERREKLKVVSVDAVKDPELAARFRVTTAPSMVLFLGGVPVGQRVGRTPKRQLLAWIDGVTGV